MLQLIDLRTNLAAFFRDFREAKHEFETVDITHAAFNYLDLNLFNLVFEMIE